MNNYSLGLIGWRANSLKECTQAVEMNYAGLEKEFKLLPYVTLHLLPLSGGGEWNNPNLFLDKIPNLDFLLIHTWNHYPPIDQIQKVKPRIKYQICSFIESSNQPVDYFFGLHRKQKPMDCYIPFPYSKDFMINKPKIPKTILLDDVGVCPDCRDISKEIAEWLKPLKEEYQIYQFTKKETVASYIKPMLNTPTYEEYMNNTSQIETFIQTHAGSYEFSVLDMVGRGIRTLIPRSKKLSRETYIQPEMVEDLELSTFSNGEELIRLIKEPVDVELWNSKINLMTEMKIAVRIIDSHFQEMIR